MLGILYKQAGRFSTTSQIHGLVPLRSTSQLVHPSASAPGNLDAVILRDFSGISSMATKSLRSVAANSELEKTLHSDQSPSSA